MIKKIFKKNEIKLLWPFYLSSVLDGLGNMIITFLIIYLVNLKFSFTQIGILMAAFTGSITIFEIPGGTFADSYSRKYSTIMGYLIVGISNILIAITNNFYTILILFITSGLGVTFISGADDAWVIDNLKKIKKEKLNEEYFLKKHTILSFGGIFAPIIGAIIIKHHPIKILWVIYGVTLLIISGILTIPKEHFKPKKIHFIQALKNTFKQTKLGFKTIKKHKTIYLLILTSIIIELIYIGQNGTEPFLLSLGMKTYQLGYLFSAIAIANTILPYTIKLFKKYKPKNIITTIITINILTLLSILIIKPPMFFIASILIIINTGLYSMQKPFMSTYIHKFIPSKSRATIISIQSMATALVFTIGITIAGVLTDIFGPQNILAYGSLIGIFAIITIQKIED